MSIDPAQVETTTPTLPPFSSKRFAPAVGQNFAWHAFDSTGAEVIIEMKLVEVAPHRSSSDVEQYSMLFVGLADLMLEQGTYRISNDSTGAEDVFAVPMGPNASGLHQYVVSISRNFEAWERDAAGSADA